MVKSDDEQDLLPGKEPMVTDYCAFSKNHRCLKWIDYEATRVEPEEADQLCHGNWIEIQALQDKVR